MQTPTLKKDMISPPTATHHPAVLVLIEFTSGRIAGLNMGTGIQMNEFSLPVHLTFDAVHLLKRQ